MSQRNWRYIKLLLIHVCIFLSYTGFTQCPPNIGFEAGNFDGWVCSTGSISSTDGTISLNVSGPVNGRHTLFQNSNQQPLDPYGAFPVNCPNGSGFSIRLGNSGTGREAEQVSYTFTIPTDQNNYSIIYNYAVVFQNPGHATWEQPKFTANVYDVSNDSYIGCSSFSYAASSGLPGFKQSPIADSVFYKSWTPVTIKLSGYAGRTIRLEFTTNDCTRGGHFGYAYIDVNENCSSPISGNVNCLNDKSETLIAPYGFESYRWFNSDFSKVLGTDISLTFSPVPLANSKYAVEVTPYPDEGCIDTVYTTIIASGDVLDLNVTPNPLIACITTGVDLTAGFITAGSSPSLLFTYYQNATLADYAPTPKFVTTSGTYYIKAVNNTGCIATKPVTVKIYTPPVFTVTPPASVIRPNSIDLNTLITNSNSADNVFSFWRDSLATIPLVKPNMVRNTGRYFIEATNEGGCATIKPVSIYVAEPKIDAPNAFSPNGDGVHDTWEIPILSLYPACTVEIYNRLGQLLFRSVGYAKPWDGKYNGIDQPVATYYYVIKPAADLPNVGGSVTIIR